MSSFTLTRFAPTPNGFLHLGNVYSFIITASLAKKNNAKILLRIDDLDQERVKKKYVQDIFDTLDFMEIPYHLGPKDVVDFEKNFSQSLKMPLYNQALEDLKKKGSLFVCDCSRNKIEKMDPKGYYTGFCRTRKLSFDLPETSWRIKAPLHQEVKIKTLTEGKMTRKIPGILADFVVKKRDGLPSYQLASVVDDLHYGVDLVVRGKDLLGSSLAQIYLSGFLPKNEFAQNTFHHHNILTGANNQKLSKSAGDTSIQFLRKSGKKPAEIFQMIGEWMGSKEKFNSLEDFKDIT
jgi:glutamyl/glutaminyl-tRNA synthetase